MAYRVLIAQFMHETNTFSKLPTTLEDYRKRWLIEGEEMVPRFTGTKNEVGGYIDSVKKYGWEPVWAAAANATPSGKLTKETWEHIRDMIVDAAKKAGKLDAICLSLHGAAVTDDRGRCRGRAARGAARPSSGRTCRWSPRSTCTPMPRCKMATQRQCAGELSHLSAHRRLRARGAGGGARAGGDGGQEEADVPAGPAGDAARRRSRHDHAARPDARPAGQGRRLREGAGHQCRQRPGRLHLGRHSLYRPVDRGELRARRRGARQGDRGRDARRDLEAPRREYRRTTGRSPTRSPRRRPASARTGRWSWPTAPTIRAAAATTTPRRCCRR